MRVHLRSRCAPPSFRGRSVSRTKNRPAAEEKQFFLHKFPVDNSFVCGFLSRAPSLLWNRAVVLRPSQETTVSNKIPRTWHRWLVGGDRKRRNVEQKVHALSRPLPASVQVLGRLLAESGFKESTSLHLPSYYPAVFRLPGCLISSVKEMFEATRRSALFCPFLFSASSRDG